MSILTYRDYVLVRISFKVSYLEDGQTFISPLSNVSALAYRSSFSEECRTRIPRMVQFLAPLLMPTHLQAGRIKKFVAAMRENLLVPFRKRHLLVESVGSLFSIAAVTGKGNITVC